MKVTVITRESLACRREMRAMEALGYERISGPWDIFRGGRVGHRIIDAKIDVIGRNVWVKCQQAKD